MIVNKNNNTNNNNMNTNIDDVTNILKTKQENFRINLRKQRNEEILQAKRRKDFGDHDEENFKLSSYPQVTRKGNSLENALYISLFD
jgi:hypothetical protein